MCYYYYYYCLDQERLWRKTLSSNPTEEEVIQGGTTATESHGCTCAPSLMGGKSSIARNPVPGSTVAWVLVCSTILARSGDLLLGSR